MGPSKDGRNVAVEVGSEHCRGEGHDEKGK